MITIDCDSNFRHLSGLPRFVIQAWSNTDGWQSTKHQFNDLPMAVHIARAIKADSTKWIGSEREVQIVDRDEQILPINIL